MLSFTSMIAAMLPATEKSAHLSFETHRWADQESTVTATRDGNAAEFGLADSQAATPSTALQHRQHTGFSRVSWTATLIR